MLLFDNRKLAINFNLSGINVPIWKLTLRVTYYTLYLAARTVQQPSCWFTSVVCLANSRAEKRNCHEIETLGAEEFTLLAQKSTH